MKMHRIAGRFVSPGILAAALCACCGCGTSGPARDDQFARQMDRGGQAFEKNQPAAAQQHFEEAYKRAMAMNQPVDAVDAGYNAALCSAQANQYSHAEVLLDSAMSVRRIAGLVIPWDMLLLKAKLLAQQEKPAAEAMAREAMAAADGPEEKSACKLFIVRLQLAEARYVDAEKMLAGITQKGLDVGQQGEYAALNGAVLSMKGLPDAAAQAFVHAVSLQQKAGLYAEMTGSMRNAAECYEQAGDRDRAVSWYLQCASAFYGQERLLDASNAVKQAMTLLETTNNREQVDQAANLLELIRAQMGEAPDR